MPIFDNDYATAMSAFLDDSATGTGGSGLMVDGVEANRATVSASAVQEVRINQDPYSAQYYWPGRGQMEIITKSAADHYHGQFNFLFPRFRAERAECAGALQTLRAAPNLRRAVPPVPSSLRRRAAFWPPSTALKKTWIPW